MTTADLLAYADHIEYRALANLAHMQAFVEHSYAYAPNFTMIPDADAWDIPHPYDDAPPNEWERVVLASLGAAVVITCFATIVALGRS